MAPSVQELVPRGLPGSSDTAGYGNGQVNGATFNNAGIFILFAVLGSMMVVTAIWFFFFAKNGGFRRLTKDDWDDYKSTVLRRKGPDGKTLSNATKSTRLGGGSVVPKWAKTEYTRSTESSYAGNEMREVEEGRGHKGHQYRQTSRHDPELTAYKTEKVAKVGGLNTSLHGSQWDHSNTDRSEATYEPVSKKDNRRAEKERKAAEKAYQKEIAKGLKEGKKAQKATEKKRDQDHGGKEAQRQKRGQPSAAYSFQQGDDVQSSVYTATDTRASHQQSIRQVSNASYYDSYRPTNDRLPPVREQPTPASSTRSGGHSRPGTASNRASRESMGDTRQASPRKQYRPPPSSYSADSGTKVYEHHIPGLSKGEVGVEDSVSQVGGRRHHQQRQAPTSSSGYRRGGARGRGDELSENDM